MSSLPPEAETRFHWQLVLMLLAELHEESLQVPGFGSGNLNRLVGFQRTDETLGPLQICSIRDNKAPCFLTVLFMRM